MSCHPHPRSGRSIGDVFISLTHSGYDGPGPASACLPPCPRLLLVIIPVLPLGHPLATHSVSQSTAHPVRVPSINSNHLAREELLICLLHNKLFFSLNLFFCLLTGNHCVLGGSLPVACVIQSVPCRPTMIVVVGMSNRNENFLFMVQCIIVYKM